MPRTALPSAAAALLALCAAVSALAPSGPLSAVFASPAQAQTARSSDLRAGFEEFRKRLALTPRQETQTGKILKDYIEAQIATLDKYDIDPGARDKPVEPGRLRALLKALQANGRKAEAELAKVLTAGQVAAFERLRAERIERLRNRFAEKRVDDLGAKLGLGAAQLAEARPILLAGFAARMAILDKHGIEPGSGKRPGLRTLLALRKDMKRNNGKTEKRLSTVLTAAQMEAYKAHVEEQRKKLRARLLNR